MNEESQYKPYIPTKFREHDVSKYNIIYKITRSKDLNKLYIIIKYR